MKKPRVLTRCVANAHAGPGERIVEFSFPDGTGGLISFHTETAQLPNRVEVYRTDPSIEVVGAQPGRRKRL